MMEELLTKLASEIKPRDEIQEDCARILVGRCIHRLRTLQLEMTLSEFARLTGWEETQVDLIEHGDFEDKALDKLVFVAGKIRSAEGFQKVLASRPPRSTGISKKRSRVKPRSLSSNLSSV